MVKSYKNIYLSTLLFTAVITFTQNTFAQSSDDSRLEEVVVTAQKKEQGLAEVPISITVMSGERMAQLGVTTLEGLSTHVPGLVINKGAGEMNIYMRGVGSGANKGFSQSITQFIDGMPIMGGLSTVYGLQGIPTSLIQQVEVIKGPASTLFGSEAMAGLINVVTKNINCIPKFGYEFSISSWGEIQNSISFKILDNKRIRAFTAIDAFNYNNPIDNNGDNFTDLTLKNRYSI